MNAFVIDAFEFCRVKDRCEGETAVADLPRLAQESVDQFGSLRWSLQGGSSSQGHPQLTMDVSGAVRLTCQRCLRPFDFGIQSESVLILAQDEASADELDALLVDEEVEVIVGSRICNFLDLIEDEALLALPLSPRHEVCPDPILSERAGEAEKVSPFAVLKDLKRK